MFKTVITQTPFTTSGANICFPNITGQTFGPDISFLATLRALLAPRMKEDESIHLAFGSSNYSSGAVGSMSAEAVHSICDGYVLTSNQLVIHSFKADQVSNMANFNLIESKFTSVYKGYHRLDKLKAFYRKSFHVDCYVNPDMKSAIVFVENLDYKRMHYLQVSILAILPWYFDPKVGMSEEEMELVYALRENSADKYNQCLVKMAKKYDFRSITIRKLLSGFETRYEKLECERVRNEILGYNNKISDLNSAIGDCLRRRNDSCIRLMGLEQKIAEGVDSEIMEYFLCNQHLILERVTDRDMLFSVKAYLEYFDSDMAERAIENRSSFVYYSGLPSRGEEGAEKAKKLLTEIFVKDNPRLRICFCAAYRLDLNGGVSPVQDHEFGFECSGYMPNPHIDRYQCLGNYQTKINSLLTKRDYIGAVEQCVASCKSLNWGDFTVMETFMSRFWGSARCIELPDGTIVNAGEAIQWLEEQEKPVETMAAVDEEKKEERVDEQVD